MGFRQNATEKMGQKCSGEQSGWIDYQSFELDLMGEGDGVPCDKDLGMLSFLKTVEKSHSVVQWDLVRTPQRR